MIRFVVLFVVLLAVAACIDRIDLPIRTEEPRLVIDGQITNEAPPYSLSLTYSGVYGGGDGNPLPNNRYVAAAQVRIADDQGRSAVFAERGLGVYQTFDDTFRGQVGRTYSLTVVLSDGKRYVTQPETMPAVPAIDSVSAQLIRTDHVATPYLFAYGVNTQDPASERNFYRWTAYGYTSRQSTGVPCSLGSPAICFDRCWVPVSSTDIVLFSDDAINGKPIRNRRVFLLPVYSLAPQFVEVQQYGLTRDNYQFWQLYRQQSTRTGTIFDPLPAPIAGNVVNAADPSDRARGYFAVTSVVRWRVRAQNFNVPFYSAVASRIAGQLLPQGDCRRTYGPVPVTAPADWTP